MQTTKNAPIEALLKAIGKNLENRTNQAKQDRLSLARLTDLNRNTVGAALSGRDMKLSTLIRLTRALGHTGWLTLLTETPTQTPMEQITNKSKPGYKLQKVRGDRSLTENKPASRPMGRNREKS
jgi:hypothetical protein